MEDTEPALTAPFYVGGYTRQP